MKKGKNSIFTIISSKSNYEILSFLGKSQKPLQFKDLKFIENPNTSKKYSSRTISKILKELEEKELIKDEIIEKKRKVIGYSITQIGKQTLEILKEAEEKYKKIK